MGGALRGCKIPDALGFARWFAADKVVDEVECREAEDDIMKTA